MAFLKLFYVRVLIIVIIAIAIIIWISISLSYQYDYNLKISYLNYATLSQFLAGIGSLLAVIIALFINQINKYFDKTDITLESNPYDGNFNYNNNAIVLYYLHLKVINKNFNSPVNHFTLLLEPSSYGKLRLDIPRPFSFASNVELFEKNILFDDYINLCCIELSFSTKVKANLSLLTDNNVEFDLLKNKKITFSVLAYSSSLKKSKKFKIIIETKTKELEQFIQNCKTLRDIYIIENTIVNEINEIKESFNFDEFYNYLKVTVHET